LRRLQVTKKEQVPLSDKEMADVQRVARQYGMTEDEASSAIVRKELEHRMRRRKAPIKRR
jgi:hypothetical protein